MRGLALLLSSAVILSGCKNSSGGFRAAPSGGAGADIESIQWSPEEFELNCAAGSCPSQVGMVVFVFPPVNNRYPLKKCTGFVAESADRIFTNGHCDFIDQAKGFFLTSADSPGGRQTIRIKRLIKKQYTQIPGSPDEDSGRPDIAVFELAKPVEKIQPLALATSATPAANSLVGYVANGDRDGSKYTIDKISCQVKRHEAYFPFDASETPDVIKAFHCSSRKTNSGSPLFAVGREDTVEAIVQSNSETTRRVFGRLPSIRASSVRCLDAGVRCIANDPQTVMKRFEKTRNLSVEHLTKRSTPSIATSGIHYQPYAYELQSSGEDDLQFEVVYWPICRTEDTIPAGFNMPSELVHLRYDEWATPHEERGAIQMSNVTVSRQSNSKPDQIFLDVSWAANYAPLKSRGDDPRNRLGSRFSIELPKCAR